MKKRICLDKKCLIEIAKGNPAYSKYINDDFLITDLTLSEFYEFLLKKDELLAEYWCKKLSPYARPASQDILMRAARFRKENKIENINDCISYIFSLDNNLLLITPNSGLSRMKEVVFVK